MVKNQILKDSFNMYITCSPGELKTIKHNDCGSGVMRLVEFHKKIYLYCSECKNLFKINI